MCGVFVVRGTLSVKPCRVCQLSPKGEPLLYSPGGGAYRPLRLLPLVASTSPKGRGKKHSRNALGSSPLKEWQETLPLRPWLSFKRAARNAPSTPLAPPLGELARKRLRGRDLCSTARKVQKGSPFGRAAERSEAERVLARKNALDLTNHCKSFILEVQKALALQDGLRLPAAASCLERHSHLAGRGPNKNSLFLPQAAGIFVAASSLPACQKIDRTAWESWRSFFLFVITVRNSPCNFKGDVNCPAKKQCPGLDKLLQIVYIRSAKGAGPANG